jgi:hypothetical protein
LLCLFWTLGTAPSNQPKNRGKPGASHDKRLLM